MQGTWVWVDFAKSEMSIRDVSGDGNQVIVSQGRDQCQGHKFGGQEYIAISENYQTGRDYQRSTDQKEKESID